MKIQMPWTAITVATIAAFAVGCGPSNTTKTGVPPSESTLKGEIQINGSSTVLPVSNAVQEQFRSVHPGVVVNVKGDGTGNGFEEFRNKKIDLSGASRPIKPGELAKCQEAGIQFVELPVAYDGLTIVVNPKNDWVESLTVEQLKKIFVGSNAAKKWSDVDPSWPAEDINVFAPGTGSGTYDYFKEVVAHDDDAEMRDDMNLNEDDNVLVQGVAGNKFSIGFFGVAYFEENKSRLRAVPIVNPDDQVAYMPTTENIAANRYAPFSRPLFLYVNTDSLNRAEVQAFVQYYLENVSELCEKVGYVRLPEQIMDTSTANMDAVVTGTHFVDSEGNSRSGTFSDLFLSNLLTN